MLAGIKKEGKWTSLPQKVDKFQSSFCAHYRVHKDVEIKLWNQNVLEYILDGAVGPKTIPYICLLTDFHIIKGVIFEHFRDPQGLSNPSQPLISWPILKQRVSFER